MLVCDQHESWKNKKGQKLSNLKTWQSLNIFKYDFSEENSHQIKNLFYNGIYLGGPVYEIRVTQSWDPFLDLPPVDKSSVSCLSLSSLISKMGIKRTLFSQADRKIKKSLRNDAETISWGKTFICYISMFCMLHLTEYINRLKHWL